MSTRERPIEITGHNPAITPEMRKIAQEAMAKPPGSTTWSEAFGRVVEFLLLPLWIALAVLWLGGRTIAAWRSRAARRRMLKELCRARGGSVNALLARWTAPDGAATLELGENGHVDVTLGAQAAGPRVWAFHAGHQFNGPRGPRRDGDHADEVARFFDAATVAQLDRLSDLLAPAGRWVLSSGSSPERAMMLEVRGLERGGLADVADVFQHLARQHEGMRVSPPLEPPRVDAAWSVTAAIPTTVEVRAGRLDQFYRYPYDGQLEVHVRWSGPLKERQVPYLEVLCARDRSVLPCGFTRGGLFQAGDPPAFSTRFDERFYVKSSLSDEATKPLLPPHVRQDLIDLFEAWMHPFVQVDPDGVRLCVDWCAVSRELVDRLVALALRIAAAIMNVTIPSTAHGK